LLHEAHCLSKQVHQLLASHHLQPELALQGAQLGTIARLVAARLGVSLVLQMMVEDELVPGCVSLPFGPPAPLRELNLLRNPLRVRSKAAAAFQEEAEAFFRPRENTR
jgi:LysR family hydrogen peroxide-inducible transcriptional activator